MSHPPVVLGLRALNLGDFCTAVPAWKALRRAFPDHRTVLAAPGWQRPLVALCPAIDELVPTDALAPVPRPAHRAAVAVNLHGRGPESSRLLAASDPGQLVAFFHDDVVATIDGPRWDDDEHEVTRWCRLVTTVGAGADPTDLALERPTAAAPRIGATVLHAGASAPARCWPVERWARVTRALRRRGHDVVLTGTAAELPRSRRISALADLEPTSDLTGRTGLAELAALVAHARLVVSGDTGTAHLASAYGTPSVVLFGPTPPTRWGPPAAGPHRVLWAGERGDPHGDEVHPGLLALSVDAVLAAVDDLTAADDRAPGPRRRPAKGTVTPSMPGAPELLPVAQPARRAAADPVGSAPP
jgi:ADP-heptose:LPS heptosyltransferase